MNGGADPQGLQQVRPARTELPTADFLPTNPFTAENVGGGIGGVYSVSFPDSGIQVGDYVRLMILKVTFVHYQVLQFLFKTQSLQLLYL